MAQPMNISGGDTLFAAGDASDALYLVVTGRLRAFLPDGRVAGDIGRSEPIGEIGLIEGQARGASVVAFRDSMLLKIARDDFFTFLYQHPSAMMAMTQVIIKRLRQNTREAKREAAQRVCSFAVVSAQGLDDFARAFAHSLGAKLIQAKDVDEALGLNVSNSPDALQSKHIRLMQWLAEIETQHRYVVYQAGQTSESWASRCLRQADRILVVADAQQTPQVMQWTHAYRHLKTPVDLVLLRGAYAGEVLAWKRAVGASNHYFVRHDHQQADMADMASLARQLTGHALGLVLGGGGARGFAHIGLIKALQERGVAIDLVGGTSMGAFIGAMLAQGWDAQKMRDICFETFVSHNYLNDYTLPRVSIIRGRKFLQRLQAIFGDTRVEALITPFFCVSTNLTRGSPMQHQDGPLAMWLAASMCVPGFAPPIAYRGELLADGAVVNSLPTDLMQDMARGGIIASDVSTEGDIRAPGVQGPDPEAVMHPANSEDRVSLIDVLFRTATLTSESGVKLRAARADTYLRMPVAQINMFDWKRLDEIIDKGYQYTQQQWDKLPLKMP
jgi:predicted acylesterase/phospholipase RssA/CRP-like cAMP-binding protein